MKQEDKDVIAEDMAAKLNVTNEEAKAMLDAAITSIYKNGYAITATYKALYKKRDN